MGRHSCNKLKLRKGLWSPEEDEKLRNHIVKYGHRCWSSVPKLAGLQRCGKSCRLRWINYLRPDLKRGAFSDEEECIVIELHAALGNRWSQIAAHLPGRTDNEIKNLWNSCIKKKLRERGIDPSTHEPLEEFEAGGERNKTPSDSSGKTFTSSEVKFAPIFGEGAESRSEESALQKYHSESSVPMNFPQEAFLSLPSATADYFAFPAPTFDCQPLQQVNTNFECNCSTTSILMPSVSSSSVTEAMGSNRPPEMQSCNGGSVNELPASSLFFDGVFSWLNFAPSNKETQFQIEDDFNWPDFVQGNSSSTPMPELLNQSRTTFCGETKDGKPFTQEVFSDGWYQQLQHDQDLHHVHPGF